MQVMYYLLTAAEDRNDRYGQRRRITRKKRM